MLFGMVILNSYRLTVRRAGYELIYIKILLERFSIVFTANVRLKFPVYQKLVKFIWFQLIFCLLATAMEQVLKTEK